MTKKSAAALKTDYRRSPQFLAIHELWRKWRFSIGLRKLVDPGGTRLNPEYRIEANHAWYLVGDAKFQQGELRLAQAAFRRALKSDPTDYMAWGALAECHSETGHYQLAKRFYLRAVHFSDGADSRLLYNLANAHLDLGEFREAIELYMLLLQKRGRIRPLASRNLAIAREGLAMAKK